MVFAGMGAMRLALLRRAGNVRAGDPDLIQQIYSSKSNPAIQSSDPI